MLISLDIIINRSRFFKNVLIDDIYKDIGSMFIIDKFYVFTIPILLRSEEKLFTSNLFHNSIAVYYVGRESRGLRGSR